MKKTIIAGIILSVFVLVALPSVNAIQGDAVIQVEKSNKFKQTKLSEFFSIAKELGNNETPRMFFSSSLLIISICLSVLLAAIIYVYVSGMVGNDTAFPSISFTKDEQTDTLTVASTDENILWSDLDVQGQCNTEGLSLYVTVGDQITECNGEIRIIHIPSNAILGVFTFN